MPIPLHCQKPEDIFKCSASEIEGMNEAELLELFGPCLAITRPELAKQRVEDKKDFMGEIVSKSGSKSRKSENSTNEALAKARAIADKLGLKLNI